MRRRVIAHGGLTNRCIDDGIHFIAHADGLFDEDYVRAHSLNRVVAAGHLGDDRVVIVGVQLAAVADLASGFGIKRSVVKNYLTNIPNIEFTGTAYFSNIARSDKTSRLSSQ